MVGMDPRIRDDILEELQSHLAEAAATAGGDARRALAGMDPPAAVGREYRRVYGFGAMFKILFAAVAFLLAVPSSPILQVTAEYPVPNLLAIPFLVLLVVWIMWVSIAAGSKAGLLAGLAAFAARAVVEAWLVITPPYPAPTAAGLGLFLVTGLVLVLLGWLPGTAKKVWSKPSGDL
jgi:hypothetical protein